MPAPGLPAASGPTRAQARVGAAERGDTRWRAAGRCYPRCRASTTPDELAEAVAWQLLARWGVVFRDVYLNERLAVPWREILWALRRLEARGLIRGGHFVTGVTGEQFADETTVSLLRPRQGGKAFAQQTPRSSEPNERRSSQMSAVDRRARAVIAHDDG